MTIHTAQHPDELRCPYCKEPISIPPQLTPSVLWVGTCPNGHKALYQVPQPKTPSQQ